MTLKDVTVRKFDRNSYIVRDGSQFIGVIYCDGQHWYAWSVFSKQTRMTTTRTKAMHYLKEMKTHDTRT